MLLSQETIRNTLLGDKVREQCLAYPERVIQIGEGNFLRAFADWVIHRLNVSNRFKGRIVVASPRAHGHKNIQQINAQNGLYTVWLRGLENGTIVDKHEVVTSVSRGIDPSRNWESFLGCAESWDIQIVISNTTESGLVYQYEDFQPSKPMETFPAKLTAYLYHRYQTFHGTAEAGMTIIPCELVDDNGMLLKQFVLRHASDWGLPTEFLEWVKSENRFCNTLVDRIVTGKPSLPANDVEQELGYNDSLVTIAEPFHLWVIEGDTRLKNLWQLHADDTLNVHIVDDVAPYRLKKIRILNGSHTAMSVIAHFAGIDTVGQVVADDIVGSFIHDIIHQEIVPSLFRQGILKSESEAFANAVWERFSNPFLQHKITSLTLNGIAKLKARILPTIADYVALYGQAPRRLGISLAAFLLFYKNADNPQSQWEIPDSPELVARIQDVWRECAAQGTFGVVSGLLSLTDIWGEDLNPIPGLPEITASAVDGISKFGLKGYLKQQLLRAEGGR